MESGVDAILRPKLIILVRFDKKFTSGSDGPLIRGCGRASGSAIGRGTGRYQ